MKVSNNAVSICKRYEQAPGGGWGRKPYKCPAGLDTVGWGHVVLLTDNFTYPMSAAAADALLMADLNKFAGDVSALLFVEPTQDQFDALVCLAFNTGVGKADGINGDFADSTLLFYFNTGKMQLAAADFIKWCRGGGRILNGLVARRKTEANLFINGTVVFYN